MEYLSCPGPITFTPDATCAAGWVAVDGAVTLTLSELSTSNLAALIASALVVMCIAYGFKVLRKHMGY